MAYRNRTVNNQDEHKNANVESQVNVAGAQRGVLEEIAREGIAELEKVHSTPVQLNQQP